jgi:hypothetical protein
MKNYMVTRLLKVFPVFLLAAVPLSLSITWAQPIQDSIITAQNSAEFVPPDFFYFSVFDQYQRYQEETVTSWPEANANVGRIGGWRFYAEEASLPDPSGPQSITTEQPRTSPLIDDSNKHKGHGGKP